MFGDINEVRIMGNLTRDPELRTITSGTSVCNFSVATNRRYLQNEEWKEEVEFHNVVIWAQKADSFVQRAKKGTRVYIEGRLQTRSWEDQNGSKQFKTEIVASRVILIDRFERPEGEFTPGEQDSNSKSEAPKSDAPKKDKKASPKAENSSEEKIDPDDLPF